MPQESMCPWHMPAQQPIRLHLRMWGRVDGAPLWPENQWSLPRKQVSSSCLLLSTYAKFSKRRRQELGGMGGEGEINTFAFCSLYSDMSLPLTTTPSDILCQWCLHSYFSFPEDVYMGPACPSMPSPIAVSAWRAMAVCSVMKKKISLTPARWSSASMGSAGSLDSGSPTVNAAVDSPGTAVIEVSRVPPLHRTEGPAYPWWKR